MILAETAYNIISALPEAEKERLYSMLKLESKEVKLKQKKDDGHWTKAEATDYLTKLFSVQAERNAAKIKKPEAATSGSKRRQLTPLISN